MMSKIGKLVAAALMTGLLLMSQFPMLAQAQQVCPMYCMVGQPCPPCPSGGVTIVGVTIISGGTPSPDQACSERGSTLLETNDRATSKVPPTRTAAVAATIHPR